jgi:hypothetical protein
MASKSIPKSLTRIEEQWHGYPVRFVIISFAMGCVALLLMARALTAPTIAGKVIVILILLMTVTVYGSYMRTPKILERSWLSYKFFIRSMRGENVIAKYTVPDGFLESIIPLRAFYQGGLIEFLVENQKVFGILYRYVPDRVSDDEIDSHIAKGRFLVDSLYGDLLMKFNVFNSTKSRTREVEKQIMNTINNTERTSEQKDHLYSLKSSIHEKNQKDIDWGFYVFVKIGAFKTVDEATIAHGKYTNGMKNMLNKMKMTAIPITNPKELSLVYRECMTGGL